ncbi:hypothetical protein, partial [Ammoniphilus oxalaticus]|uniref:hypothetical protein n=1 Tax=Ammoniphilus oxalaticus TaxID=66863 RepID=UPI001B86AC55
ERDYKIQLEVKSQDDMVGRSEMVDFRTSFIKPRPPSILLSQDSVFATTTILIENPTPVGEEPNIIINEIYRKRYGESDWVKVGEAMTIFTDYQCPAGAIQYMAVAKGDNGTRSEESDMSLIDVMFSGWWVVDMETNDMFNFVYNVSQGQISLEEERQEIRTFSSKPFVRYGAFSAERGSLAGLKIDGPGTAREQVNVLRELISRRKPFYLKNNRGESWVVNIYNLKRQYNIGMMEMPSIDWVEVR